MKIFNQQIFILLINCNMFKLLNSMNFDVVFSLRDHFKSDLILFVQRDQKDLSGIKLFKHKKIFPQSFKGVVNTNFDDFYKSLLSSSRFKNIMVVTNKVPQLVQNLIEVERRNPKLSIMSRFIWVVFVEKYPMHEIVTLHIPFNSKFLLITQNSTEFEIIDVYQVKNDTEKIYSKFGTWDKMLDTQVTNFYSRRMDLKGITFKIQTTSVEARNLDLWRIFSTTMNFSLTWKTYASGALYPNGTTTGFFKAIKDHIIDGTPSNFVINEDRINHFDCIFPTYITDTKMYVASIAKLKWSSFIAPFSYSIWICILIWIIIASIIKFSIMRFGRYNRHPDNAIFSVLISIFNQSSAISTSSASVYIVTLMPYFLGIVLVQYYSGVLLSYLALKETFPPFKNLQEVAKDGSYKIFVWKHAYIYHYFLTDPGEVPRRLRKGMLIPVQDEGTTFPILCQNHSITIRGTLDYKIEAPCEISEISESISLTTSGMLVWKGFPYKDVMTKLMKKVQFAGLVILKQKNTIVQYQNSEKAKSLSLEMLFPIFLLYVLFILISFVIFVVEKKIA